MKAYWGGIIAPLILNLGTESRLVVSATPRPLLKRRLVGSQSRSGRFGEKVSWCYRNSNSGPITSTLLLLLLLFLLLLLLLRQHYSPMRTFASLNDLSQSALFFYLFPVFNFPFINICLYIVPSSVFWSSSIVTIEYLWNANGRSALFNEAVNC